MTPKKMNDKTDVRGAHSLHPVVRWFIGTVAFAGLMWLTLFILGNIVLWLSTLR
jgi:hypothetical protein